MNQLPYDFEHMFLKSMNRCSIVGLALHIQDSNNMTEVSCSEGLATWHSPRMAWTRVGFLAVKMIFSDCQFVSTYSCSWWPMYL